MFLNRQNIVNVAISRAKDYLFVLMPDEDTENVQNLFLINKLRRIIEKDLYIEKTTRELEELLFDNETYLEENAFSTGHQLVNVYGVPEKRYEIRSEETAVDVQVHGEVYYAPFEAADEEDRPLTLEELAQQLIGQEVSHAQYGIGTVTECEDRLIKVSFDGEEHKFAFPYGLKGHLSVEDQYLQEKINQILE
jgi:hypothetical protein